VAPPATDAPQPTLESIREAHRTGKSDAEIVAWIGVSGASFDLTLEDALQLRAEGLSLGVISAMARAPEEKLLPILGAAPATSPPATGRVGLSKRRILKMVHEGTPEIEILKAITEQGSRASLRLDEALRLHTEGVSPALLIAMVTTSAPAPGEVAAAAPAGGAPPEAAQAIVPAPPAPADAGTPTLDEALGSEASPAPAGAGAPTVDEALRTPGSGEEEDATPTIDDALGQQAGEEEKAAEPEAAPTIDEIVPEEETGEEEEPGAVPSFLYVLSDPPGARVYTAPGAARTLDLLKQAKGGGHAPARIKLSPGPAFVLVEKKLDSFDLALIPALRTVHDGDGRTRTLIESGDIYYDAQRCCLPRSLSGLLSIGRISEDQQGMLLGDEFDGLPPYLWDGNRFLILSIRDAKVARALKVYEIRKAAGESRTLLATFIASSAADPLAPRPAAEGGAEAESEARGVWSQPEPAEVDGIQRAYGIPKDDASRMAARLSAEGKAVWRQKEADGSVRIVALGLDANGRINADEYLYRTHGPYGMLSTPVPPAPRKKKKAQTAPVNPVAPLAPLTRVQDADTFLPVLSISNDDDSAAVVRLWDGTSIFVASGASRDLLVNPGSGEIEARFLDRPDEPRRVRAHFSYGARYTMRVD